MADATPSAFLLATLRRDLARAARRPGGHLDVDARPGVGVGYGPAPTSSTRALEAILGPPDLVSTAPAREITRRFRRRFTQRLRRYLVRHPGCSEADAASALFAADPALYDEYRRAVSVMVTDAPAWTAARHAALARAADHALTEDVAARRAQPREAAKKPRESRKSSLTRAVEAAIAAVRASGRRLTERAVLTHLAAAGVEVEDTTVRLEDGTVYQRTTIRRLISTRKHCSVLILRD